MFATAILQSLPVELLFTVAFRHGAVRCYILLLQCLMGGVRVGREIIFFKRMLQKRGLPKVLQNFSFRATLHYQSSTYKEKE